MHMEPRSRRWAVSRLSLSASKLFPKRTFMKILRSSMFRLWYCMEMMIRLCRSTSVVWNHRRLLKAQLWKSIRDCPTACARRTRTWSTKIYCNSWRR